MEVVNNIAIKASLPIEVADKILRDIDKSELLDQYNGYRDILMFWGHRESTYLTSLLDLYRPNSDIPEVPSPMNRDYTWPGIHKPFNHQRVTSSFLSLRHRAFCFNEAGTAKTASAIWAADYLMNIGEVKRVLVVCPLSIMYTAWQADIFKTAMHRSVGIAYGEKDKRVKVVNGAYDFVIINYDGVNVIKDEIKKAKFDLIVIDEANAYKTTSTKRWKNMVGMIEPSTRLWLMTGTPAAQSPVDAYGLAKLVSPMRVPRFITGWRDRVTMQVSRFKWLPKPDAERHVFVALQPAIRYTKKECLDLPDVLHVTRDVPLTPQAASYYKKLKTQLQIEAAGEKISAVNAASSMSKLMQISGGAVYTDGRDIVEFDVSPRLEVLKEVLDETINKVIVFVPYLHTIEVVRRYLVEVCGIKCDVIKGSVNPKDRRDIINRFQSQPDPRVLVIQPQSASHGVTLTAADTIVFWSPVLSVETYIQCIGRIDRVGQVNKMTVVNLQGSDAERKVYDMLQGKVDSHLKLVDLYKQELENE